jgi:zinc transporter ZupT
MDIKYLISREGVADLYRNSSTFAMKNRREIINTGVGALIGFAAGYGIAKIGNPTIPEILNFGLSFAACGGLVGYMVGKYKDLPPANR